MTAAESLRLVLGQPAFENLQPSAPYYEDRGYITECLIWHAGRTNGYGRWTNFREDGTRPLAHVALWEEQNGPVPDGFTLHHLCFQPPCVLLGHLELLTRGDHLSLHAGLKIPHSARMS